MDAGPLLLVSLLAFASIALVAFEASSALAGRERVRRRFGGVAPAGAGSVPDGIPEARPGVDWTRFGVTAEAQRALRAELVRAGFFGPGALPAFLAARLALPVALPAIGLLLASGAPPNFGTTGRAALALVLLAIGLALPKAVLKRRQRRLETSYRVRFPDFLDMLVVCVNAGLSLEASLDRSGRELGRDDAAFRFNLDAMAGEMRAGKSTSDALRSFADRLGLPEARAFASLLRQTIELGTDVVGALTVFSDEMRDRRMAVAEEKAAALPPKLTLPLGLCIFPVVLVAILAPAVMRIMAAAAP